MMASHTEVMEKNRAYDRADSPVWRLAVYDAVHDGWEFTNMGGALALDFIGARAGLNGGKQVLEFCSGLGAACRYMASKFGCRVTGIELNANQVTQAQAKAAELNTRIASLISFECCDALDWLPTRRYDLVYMIDSLMLVENMKRMLGKCFEALRPGGMLGLVEMIAGPNIDPPLRNLIWEIDGIINLPTIDEYEALLQAAGFRDLRFEAITETAQRCFDKIGWAVAEHRQTIIEAEGEGTYRGWSQIADLYSRSFKSGKLGYVRITATRP